MKNDTEMKEIGLYELYNVIELSNGTINIDNILSMVPKGKFVLKELPGKEFYVVGDKEKLERLVKDYQKGGVAAIQKYGN